MYKINSTILEQAIRLTHISHRDDQIVIDRAYQCDVYDVCFAIRYRSAHTPARFIGTVSAISAEDGVALAQAQAVPVDDEDDRLVTYFPGVIVEGPLTDFDEPEQR